MDENITAVLTYQTCGHQGVVGQTMGADGAGSYAVVFYGDEEKAQVEAREYVRKMESAGFKIQSLHFVTASEGWGALAIKTQVVG